MKKVCWLITIFLSIALVFLPFSSFAAEINSDEMMQLILQMLGIDEETANSMAPDELQELVNQMMNGDTSSAKEEVQAVQNTEDIFADKYLTDAGFRVLDDVFAGQKVYYQPNSNVSLLTYSTKTLFWGMNVDTKIFGEDAKEDGDLPAWTEGDTSEFHDKQKKIGFYPCVVYNM